MIKKYIQAAIVITLGGIAYMFILGKSTEAPISRAYVENLFHTYEVKAASANVESFSDMNELAEIYVDIGNAIHQIERDHTIYNRLLSKKHYYEDSEIAAIESHYLEISTTHNKMLEQHLAPRRDFTNVINGEIDDPEISIDIEGKDYNITIKGKMYQPTNLFPRKLYFIDTAYGTYYWEEPDNSSSVISESYFEFHGNTNYQIKIESSP